MGIIQFKKKNKAILEKDEFIRIMRMVSIVFPLLNLNKDKLEVYFELLNDLTEKEFYLGVRELLQGKAEVYDPDLNLVPLIRLFGKEREEVNHG